jgi:hypothetical protein
MEARMADSRRETVQSAKEAEKPDAEKPDKNSPEGAALNRGWEHGGQVAQDQAAQHQAERLAELGQEGMKQATNASAAAADSALRSGSAVAG